MAYMQAAIGVRGAIYKTEKAFVVFFICQYMVNTLFSPKAINFGSFSGSRAFIGKSVFGRCKVCFFRSVIFYIPVCFFR